MAEKPTKADSAKNSAPGTAGGMMSKFMIAGFMGGVVAVECLLAYLFIPSAEQVAAMAEQNMQKKLPTTLDSESQVPTDGDDSKPAIEVELGDYSITVTQPNSATALRVDFQLVGTVRESDQAEAKSLFDRNIHRFRDMVLSEIRNLEATDLADPTLTLIKRRILEKSNALLGKPVLRSVVFSQFSYIEQ
jgi:flagellar FliL protein